MNKVFLYGHLGHSPKITNFENGGKVAQFSLATTEKGYRTKDGKEIPNKTQWHNIVVKKSGLADVCEKYLGKGTPVLIEGKIENREYQGKNGETKYITEIIVENLKLTSGSKGDRQDAPTPQPEDDDLPFC